MTQQINLFNPLFLKQRKYFSALTMLQLLGIVVLVMAVFYAWAFMTQIELDHQVAQNEVDFKRHTQQLTAIAAGLPQAQAEAKLDQQSTELENEIAARQSLLQQLAGSDSAGSSGYAGYLRALARQTVDGVWLTSVHISEAGDNLTLTGRATQADLVPELMRRLKREPLLRGRAFETLGMKRVVPRAEAQAGAALPPGAPPPRAMPPYVEFNLASRLTSSDAGSEGKGQQPAPAAPPAALNSGAAPNPVKPS